MNIKNYDFKMVYITGALLFFFTASVGIVNAAISTGSSSDSSSVNGVVMENMCTTDPATGVETCCQVCHPTVPSICGNGIIEAGEECDGVAGTDSTHTCDPKTCLRVPILVTCGDGIRKDPEPCDDGNKINDDGCTNACQLPKCGDGITQKGIGEQCDDGNDVAGDGCSPTCQYEATCGDGVMPEKVNGVDKECDAGVDNGKSTSGCSSTCKKTAYCGNGVTENPPEECDDGPLNGTDSDHCDSNCKLKSLCGNGNIDSGETCDDKNQVDGDGCDKTCHLEPIGLTCADGKQSDDGKQYTSGTYEIDSGGTITSLTAVSSTPSVCENPASVSGKSGTVTGNYVSGKNMDDCKVLVTAKDSNNQQETCTITIKGILDHCGGTYTDDAGNVRSSIDECMDGFKFTCGGAWRMGSGGGCVCDEGSSTSCT